MATLSDDSIERIANLFDRAFDPTTGFYIGFKGKSMNQLKDAMVSALMSVQAATNKTLENLAKENRELAKSQRQAEKDNFNKLNETIKETAKGKTDKNLFNEILNNLGEKGKLEAETISKLQKAATVLGKTIDGLSIAASKFKEATDRQAGFAEELRSSGMVISEAGKNFADSFSGSAAKLNMSSETFLGVLKASGTRISNLSNISAQTNLDIVKQGMLTYNKFKDTNISDARSIMDLQMDLMTSSMTSEQIRQTNLANSTELLLKRFRDLSYMTGKSIEQIAKEQELKEAQNLYDVFKSLNVVADSFMTQMNFKQSWKEFVGTGRISDELSADMAMNPELAAMLNDLRMRVASGEINNQSDIKTLTDQYNKQANLARDYAIQQGQSLLKMGAGNLSPEYMQSILAGSRIGILETGVIKQYNESDQKAMIEVFNNAGKLANAAKSAIDAMTSGNAKALDKLYILQNKRNEEIVKFYETIVGDTYNDNSWLGNKLKGIKDSLDKITGGNAFGITSGVISGLIQAGFDVWMMSKGMKWIRSLVGIANPAGQGAVSGVMSTIENAASSELIKKTLFSKITTPIIDTISTFKNASLGGKIGMGLKGGTGLYLTQRLLSDTMDLKEKGIDNWYAKYENVYKNGGFADIIGNLLYHPTSMVVGIDQLTQRALESIFGKKENTNIPASINNITEHNIVVDQIKESAKRINARPEEIKQEPVKTTSSMIEQQQKQIEINEEKSVPLELGEKTISALSEAFSKAIKPVGNYLDGIGKDNKEIARYGRNSSVGSNGTNMNPTY